MSVLLLHPLPTRTYYSSIRTLSRAVVKPREAFRLRPSFSSHTQQAGVVVPFGKSSLGLDRTFIVPYLDSIRQLPEVDAAWNAYFCYRRHPHHPQHSMAHSPATVESLRRAGQIFERMAPSHRNDGGGAGGGGGEYGAVTALLAEVQHRQGKYRDALLTLDELLKQVTTKKKEKNHQEQLISDPTQEVVGASFNVFLAKAKVQWTMEVIGNTIDLELLESS